MNVRLKSLFYLLMVCLWTVQIHSLTAAITSQQQQQAHYGISALAEGDPSTKAGDIIMEYPQQIALSGDSSFVYFIHDLNTIGKVSTRTGLYELVRTSDSSFQLKGLAISSNQTIFYSDEHFNSIYKLQNGVSTRVAGFGASGGGYSGNNLKATSSALNRPIGLFYTDLFDRNGEVYFADESNNMIRKLVIANGTVVDVAGSTVQGYSGDGGSALLSSLRLPSNVFVSNVGEIFIVDTFNCAIRKVSIMGIIETVAGNGQCGFNQDMINATAAKLNFPTSVVVSKEGDIYISDHGNHRIRKVSATTGLIETIVGGGFNTGYGIAGTSCQLNHPSYIALNDQSDLFISDSNHHRILKLSNGIITLVAGYSNVEEPVASIDNVDATQAKLKFTFGVATNTKNEVFISDAYNHRIVKIDTSGILKTVAGIGGSSGFDNNIDGMLATDVSLNYPYEIAIHPFTQDLFIADSHNSRILRVDSTSGKIYRFMGNGIAGYNNEGSDLLNLQLNNPQGLSFYGNTLIISDTFNNRVRQVVNATSSNIIGNNHGGKEPITALLISDVMLKFPRFATRQGNVLVVADTRNYILREIELLSSFYNNYQSNTGSVHTPSSAVFYQSNKYYLNSYGHSLIEFSFSQKKIGGKGFNGDFESGTVVKMRYPHSMCLDNNGDLIISDTLNSMVRKYSSNTTIFTTIAGLGTRRIPQPIVNNPKQGRISILGASVTTSGDYYCTDIAYNRILKGNTAQQLLTNFAGPFAGGINRDGPSSAFKIQTPSAIFVFNDLIYMIDNSRLLQYSKDGTVKTLFSSFSIVKEFLHVDSTGKIYFMDSISSSLLYTGFESNFQVYSGNGTDDISDGIDKSLVNIRNPSGVFYHEQKREIYYTDIYRIRKFSIDGVVSTVAGVKGSNKYSGENVPSTEPLQNPKSVYVNSIGEVFFLDANRVRKILTNGTVFTIAGNGTNGFTSYSNDATSVAMATSTSLSFNPKTGDFLIAEGRKRVSKLVPYCTEGFSLSVNDSTICIPLCFGKNSDGGACGGSNQGLCVAPNTCSCNSNWNGTQCEIDMTKTGLDSTSVILIATLVPILSILLILLVIVVIAIVVGCVLKKSKKESSSIAAASKSNIELKNTDIDLSTTTGTISDYPDDVSYFFKPSTSVHSIKTGSTLSSIDAFNPLARYTDMEKIGSGGFGSVFKCLETQSKKTKVLKAMRFNSYSELSMFMKEGLQLLNMNHPHIIKVNDLFVDKEELLFIEMEYYEKGDLNYLLKNPELCNEQILRQIVTQIGMALDFIHNEKKIIHRDIKPSNIFIKDIGDASIDVVLADFGLARENSLSNKSYAGTPMFISPELGLGSSYGPETDIYSLGVTLYQLVSKDLTTSISHYYLSKDEQQVKELLKNQMVKASHNKYSDELMTLITEMVRKDPTTRPTPKEIVKKFEK